MKCIKFNKENFGQTVIAMGLAFNGEKFQIDFGGGDIETAKVVDCHADETGEIPCSEPSCECFYYCRCNHPGCPNSELVDMGKMVVGWDEENDRMLSTFGW